MGNNIDELENTGMPALGLPEPTRQGRGTEISKSAQRVFLCWDKKLSSPKDQLVADILSRDIGVDCVVSYYDFFQKMPDDETITNELLYTRLVVLLVTPAFLRKNNKEKSPEYRIAKELHQLKKLSILPVVVDSGLFPALTMSENAIHGIAMDDSEYRKKLGEQLNNYIIGNDIVKEINRKAFSVRLFLSYRKTDIEYARNFVKTLRDVSDFEYVAVWYDNYLTAGRVFSKEIEEAILNADIFVLLVTPALFEKNAEGKTNYVLAKELPYAVKLGKKIVAVEAAPIHKTIFKSVCPNTDAYLKLDCLYEMWRLLPDKPLMSLDDERIYFLGMAYRYGILVEFSPERAIELFESIRESVSIWGIKASLELAQLYEDANIPLQYTEGEALWLKIIETQEIVLGECHADIAKSFNNLAALYYKHSRFDDALHFYQKSLTIHENALGLYHPLVAANYDNIGMLHSTIGNYDYALSYYHKALTIRAKENNDSLAYTKYYNHIAIVYKRQCDYKNALIFYKKACAINKKALGQEDSKTLMILKNIAILYFDQGEFQKALRIYRQVLSIQMKVYESDDPCIIQTFIQIAVTHMNKLNYSKSLIWLEKARQILLKYEHPDIVKTYSLMGFAHTRLGNCEYANLFINKAIELYGVFFADEKTLDFANLYIIKADVFECCGDYDEALKYYDKAIDIQTAILGPKHPHTLKTHHTIAEIKQR